MNENKNHSRNQRITKFGKESDFVEYRKRILNFSTLYMAKQ